MSFTSWSTSSWPTSTTLRSVDPTHTSDLIASLTSATQAIPTATEAVDYISLSRAIRGAEASLNIISAEGVIATATDDSVKAQATQVIFENSVNLEDLYWELSNYEFRLNRVSNIFFFTVFSLLFIYYSILPIKSRYIWFNVTFWCGYALEWMGFLGRILGFVDSTNMDYFLLGFVCLTIAPAFIMAGIYFTFGQLVVIYGRQYSQLKPMWYTYIFISFDVISLVIQAIGGGMAASQSAEMKSTQSGTNVMIAGIVFQVFSMSVFLLFWFLFLYRVFFTNRSSIADGPLKKPTPANYLKLAMNTKSSDNHKRNVLESFYNPKYSSIRGRKLLNYYPLGITVATIAIYIRCVYRVVELAQGWDGFLIGHEVYLMTLDASMVAICGLVFVPFHPYFVFGKENVLKVKHIKNRADFKMDENQVEPKSSQGSNSLVDNDTEEQPANNSEIKV